jgi:hypothetical protein
MSGIKSIKRTGYLHGGVTHPDGRRGFFKGAQADAAAGKGSMSPGTSGLGGSQAGGYGRDQGNRGDQQGDMSIRDFNTSMSNPDGTPNRFELAAANAQVAKEKEAADKLAEEQRIKALGTTGPLKTNYKISYLQNLKNKSIQKSLNRNKVLSLRKMNLMKGINPFTTQIPDWAKDLTEEELLGIATSGPYLSQQKTKADVSKFAEGKDLLGRVTEGQSILDTDNFPQSEYERLFPGNITTSMDGGGGQTILPYPYNVQQPEEEIPEDTGPDYRFGTGQGIGADVTRGYYSKGGKAEGGIMELRARRAFGGIMDRVTGRKAYGLGSLFKSVGKAVSGVAKAAGKVLSSDVGKMALMAAGTYYMGGGMKFGGAKMFGNTANSTFMGNLGRVGTFIKDNPFKSIGIASAALPFLAGGAKPNEDIGMGNRGGHLIDPLTGKEALPSEMRASLNNALDNADGDPIRIKQINDAYAFLGPDERLGTYSPYRTYGVKDGGRIGRAEGGLMDLGGMEKDYRAEGGFVPIGAKEKADDVPARLSVNEFVFTADAVRGAGGGDIDKGAEIMENMMVNLEKGGTVSEESQGNAGAQQMFNTSQRLGEVI